MSTSLELLNDDLYLLRISGELKKSDLDEVQSEFVQYILPAGSIKLLVRVENFTGWESGADWADTSFFSSHSDKFDKMAIVGDPQWEAEALAFTGAGFRKGPVKFFPETGEPDALAWLSE